MPAVETGEEEGEVVVEWNRHDGDLLQSGVLSLLKVVGESAS